VAGLLLVVEQLQLYLVDQGIGQMPDDPPSGVKPSIWMKPRQGAPAPRMDGANWLEEATITVSDTLLRPRPNLEAWVEEAYIDIVIRARQDAACQLLHRSIKGLLAPVGLLGGKQNWTMHELPILYSRTWRGEQPLPPLDDGVTYNRVTSYQVACRRSDLG
jgi:hypothetical protein